MTPILSEASLCRGSTSPTNPTWLAAHQILFGLDYSKNGIWIIDYDSTHRTNSSFNYYFLISSNFLPHHTRHTISLIWKFDHQIQSAYCYINGHLSDTIATIIIPIYHTHHKSDLPKMTQNSRSATYRRIGQGFCGTVWAASSGSFAVKREDGGPGRSLQNDYEMHMHVIRTLSHPSVQIPDCLEFVTSTNHQWWDKQLLKFPDEYQISCNTLVSQRIQPFSAKVRETIIETYCPEPLRPRIDSIKSSEPNQDCLIRPYLGRRRRLEKQSRYKSFSLRNYPLHADQIEELGLDGKLYARIMADALAGLYWKAKVDANDIEFVLAPPGKHRGGPQVIASEKLGEHVVWILDFDCCRPITLDEKGVERAVAAFYRNDPFYPRPGRDNRADQEIWEEFKTQFLKSSELMLGSDTTLSLLWVALAEQKDQQSSFHGLIDIDTKWP